MLVGEGVGVGVGVGNGVGNGVGVGVGVGVSVGVGVGVGVGAAPSKRQKHTCKSSVSFLIFHISPAAWVYILKILSLSCSTF